MENGEKPAVFIESRIFVQKYLSETYVVNANETYAVTYE